MTELAQAPAVSTYRRARFNRDQYFQRPSIKAVLKEFTALFHPYGYIFKPPGGTWQSTKDPRWQLSDSEIAKAIACVHYNFIGTRWGKNSRHAVIDIDHNSQYHNKQGLRRLLETLEAAGLANAVPYQSSESGGWHVYIFFSEPVLSRKTRDYLKKLLRLKGFTIAAGTLEVFPDPGSFDVAGQGLRLPLQPGWAWLYPQSLEIDEWRDCISPAEALIRFMSDLEENQHSMQEYNNFCYYVDHLAEVADTAAVHTKGNIRQFRPAPSFSSTPDQMAQIVEIFGTVPPNIIPERWLAGRVFSTTGLTDRSQRHLANLALGHYYFYGDPSRSLQPLGYGYEDERETLITQVLMDKHHGLSNEINKGRPEALSDINRAAHWRPVHKRNQADQEQHDTKTSAAINVRNKLANIKRTNDARSRIKAAVERMLAAGRPIRVNDLEREAKTNKTTLSKHKDLWHQHYEKQLLATGSGVYSVGMGGVTALNPSLSPVDNQKRPPQLLAARQIVSEIAARAERERKKKQKETEKIIAKDKSLWRRQVQENLDLLPREISQTDIRVLKTLIAALSYFLSISPCYEDEVWLRSHLVKVQSEHNRQLESFKIGIATAGNTS